MTAVPSGGPEVPVRPVTPRRQPRAIRVGPVAVDGGSAGAGVVDVAHEADRGVASGNGKGAQRLAERMK
ncbi:hypothetical protein [Streptomyces sp. NPDC048106]|uniref:hypothetical protein n=1 Tax=Streptomyces sp. NPDC048106 TaxID=3155750 RepID=UPI0034573111